jgi:hypothetical protein
MPNRAYALNRHIRTHGTHAETTVGNKRFATS